MPYTSRTAFPPFILNTFTFLLKSVHGSGARHYDRQDKTKVGRAPALMRSSFARSNPWKTTSIIRRCDRNQACEDRGRGSCVEASVTFVIQRAQDNFTEIEEEAMTKFDEHDGRLQTVFVVANQKFIEVEDGMNKNFIGGGNSSSRFGFLGEAMMILSLSTRTS